VLRPRLAPLARIALPLAAAIVAVAVPAVASTSASPAARSAAVPYDRAAGARAAAEGAAPGVIAPLAGPTPLAGAGAAPVVATAKATATCAAYAARAGWPDNGYYGGDLVTAATICVAESGGNPLLYVCDKNGVPDGQGNYVPGKKVSCPTGTTSYDRGLWQLNSVAAAAVGDSCAFNPVCNAGQAYLYSGRGTDFAPWSSYDQDTYVGHQFLDLVQGVVSKLSVGTVTSALLGECLAAGSSAKVVVANCGSGAASQQWLVADGKLKSGSGCAAIISAAKNSGVTLVRCARRSAQDWTAFGRDELRNAADGECLSDPGGSLAAGTPVKMAACTDAKAQTWWLP